MYGLTREETQESGRGSNGEERSGSPWQDAKCITFAHLATPPLFMLLVDPVVFQDTTVPNKLIFHSKLRLMVLVVCALREKNCVRFAHTLFFWGLSAPKPPRIFLEQ